ncbi:hypothetical protein RBI22_15760 [Alcaligenaceae bacterium C4P045]|nr:hypothetical protein [Alcaligenaceae bacterium C4P045]
MTREILAGTPAPVTTSEPAAPKATLSAVPTTANEHPDALAGALPDWDLLPATPFIRRVK